MKKEQVKTGEPRQYSKRYDGGK